MARARPPSRSTCSARATVCLDGSAPSGKTAQFAMARSLCPNDRRGERRTSAWTAHATLTNIHRATRTARTDACPAQAVSRRGDPMTDNRLTRLVCGVIVATLVLGVPFASDTSAQAKKLKIGVVYDYTGPFAGGGSELHALGAKIMIDYFIKKGGVEGYQIEAVYADAQSKPDVAINEAVRLVEQEKVDMLLGFYSSAECVPAAARVEQLKKFMWITTCISSAVLENRNLKYVFRAQPSGRQFGLMSADFVAQNTRDRKSTRLNSSHLGISYAVFCLKK